MLERFIDIPNAPTEQELVHLQLFRRRSKELDKNWDDLNGGQSFISISFSKTDKGLTADRKLPFSRFRFKGLLVDFRLFSQQKEPTHVFKIANFVKKLSLNEDVTNFVDKSRENWKEARGIAGWHNPFSADDVIDVMFNQEVFHSRSSGGDALTLELMHQQLENDTIWWETYLICRHRTQVIRNLNWIIDPLLKSRSQIRLPN
jgi:hypothetical protein